MKQSCYNLWGASRREGDSYWNFLLISARHICVDWAWERCGRVDPAHGGQQSTLALRAPTIMTGNKDSALVVAKKSFLHFYSIYSVSSVIKASFCKKKVSSFLARPTRYLVLMNHTINIHINSSDLHDYRDVWFWIISSSMFHIKTFFTKNVVLVTIIHLDNYNVNVTSCVKSW